MEQDTVALEGIAYEHFAGPPEEMDKLMAVNWNMISSDDVCSDSPANYVSAVRESPNSIRLEYVFDMFPEFDDE